MNLYSVLRPLLFELNPETAHKLTLGALKISDQLGLSNRLFPSPPAQPCEVMGLTFPNRIGLAAGLDKNGEYIDALAALGFGFIEIGTTTPRPQPGNPAPRLFRIPQARAIINRMGFNNKGVDYLIKQVKQARFRGILGINIGKNFDTPLEQAVDDYLCCMRKVYPHAGYIALNISSPNTPGLRNLQQKESFSRLIAPLKEEQQRLKSIHGRYVPLAVKVAPDLEVDEVNTIAEVLVEYAIDAVIATNTTLNHQPVEQLPHGREAGGLSGAPLRHQATCIVEQFSRALDNHLPIIGVGGIMSGADACEKLAAGATLIQIYSGLIYSGPTLVQEIAQAMGSHTNLQ
ncbi:MAG TPA: quinone-dependent dihydroorotate dehydrogenase [Gammaproteobacteria bacterium]|nr:quinone-dependent dihydroorotate dehydrogenase [Gammaproteobacteria bacterium]